MMQRAPRSCLLQMDVDDLPRGERWPACYGMRHSPTHPCASTGPNTSYEPGTSCSCARPADVPPSSASEPQRRTHSTKSEHLHRAPSVERSASQSLRDTTRRLVQTENERLGRRRSLMDVILDADDRSICRMQKPGAAPCTSCNSVSWYGGGSTDRPPVGGTADAKDCCCSDLAQFRVSRLVSAERSTLSLLSG